MKPTCRTNNLNLQRTKLSRGLGLVLLGLVAAGCPVTQPEKVVIRGSNTVGEELIPRLIAEYKTQHPGAAFDLEFKGTMYGFGELMNGRCDIAAASRDVNMNELALARDRGIEFDDSVIGSYAVAVVVNGANSLTNLTQDQVRDVFTGAVQNWKEVGGPDAPLHLYIRDPISGTYLGFRELAMENKPYGQGFKAFTNYTGIVQAVAQDANSIGYCSIDLTTKAGVKALSIGGVAPKVFSVNRGQYPYARILRLYTDKVKTAPPARAFIDFVQSAQGQKLLEQAGFVPRP